MIIWYYISENIQKSNQQLQPFNPLQAEWILFKQLKCMFTFLYHSLKLRWWKWLKSLFKEDTDSLSYTVNTMAADDLAPYVARSSAALVLTLSSWIIPASAFPASEGLN